MPPCKSRRLFILPVNGTDEPGGRLLHPEAHPDFNAVGAVEIIHGRFCVIGDSAAVAGLLIVGAHLQQPLAAVPHQIGVERQIAPVLSAGTDILIDQLRLFGQRQKDVVAREIKLAKFAVFVPIRPAAKLFDALLLALGA